MAINLEKGQRISLAKEAPGLTKLMCGLGWDLAKRSGSVFAAFGNAQNYDLDSSVICLNGNGKLTDVANVVYFGNLSHRSGAVTHLGDNLTGAGDGDDEQILIDLAQMPTEITKLVFLVNIYNCIERKQDFGQVQNAFVRLVDQSNNKELARYNLSGQEYKGMTGMIMAEIYKHNNEWKMAAIGNGVSVNGLKEIMKSYT